MCVFRMYMYMYMGMGDDWRCVYVSDLNAYAYICVCSHIQMNGRGGNTCRIGCV